MNAKKILIADDDAQFAEVLKRRCQALGLEVDTSPNGLHAWLGLITTHPPDLVILDLNMPFTDGLGICEKINAEKRLAEVPVIVVTGRSDDATRQRCDALGVRMVVKGPDTWERLQPMVVKLLGLDAAAPESDKIDTSANVASTKPPATSMRPIVLSIDDDPAISMMLKMRLKEDGVDVIRAFTGEQGFWMALKQHPNVIVSDYIMPDGNGDYLLGRLQSHPLTQSIPVIVLTGKTIEDRKDYGLARQFTNLGAVEFFTKPLDSDVLIDAIKKYLCLSGRPASAVVTTA